MSLYGAECLINRYLTNSLSCFVSFASGSLAKYPIRQSLERSLARGLVVEKACKNANEHFSERKKEMFIHGLKKNALQRLFLR
jgi:hypothetical protein